MVQSSVQIIIHLAFAWKTCRDINVRCWQSLGMEVVLREMSFAITVDQSWSCHYSQPKQGLELSAEVSLRKKENSILLTFNTHKKNFSKTGS